MNPNPATELADDLAQLRVEQTQSIAVVVLNWNNAEDTLACLRSLRSSTIPLTVITVDNGSHDGSAEEIDASGLSDSLIRTGANLGYAGGNNAGLRSALAAGYDLVMVLNNDTIAHPDMVERLLEAVAAGGPRTAISPRIVYHGAPDQVWFAGGVVDHGWPRHLQAAEMSNNGPRLHDSEILSGCCVIAAAETWQQIGLFDERYFLIFEDSDWSMRAQRSSANLMICEDAVLEHRVSRSFQSGPSSLLGTYYYTRNGLRFHLTWQRPYVGRFILQWIIRPLASSAKHGRGRRSSLFGLLGAMGCLTGRTGAAGGLTHRLATRLTRSSQQ